MSTKLVSYKSRKEKEKFGGWGVVGAEDKQEEKPQSETLRGRLDEKMILGA